MTIRELLAVAPKLLELDITVRDNGKYVYAYRIAKYVKVEQSYPYERQFVTEGERWDLKQRSYVYPFPKTFWAVDPREADEVQDLEIERVDFTSLSMSWLYKDVKSWGSQAVVACYPKGWAKPIEVAPQVSSLKGQMSITDYEVQDNE